MRLARQISVSEEVYRLLSRKKGDKSFSEVIKEAVAGTSQKQDVMRFAGILKKERKNLEKLKQKIATERETNYGRAFD